MIDKNSFSENARFIMNKFYFKKDRNGEQIENSVDQLFKRVVNFVCSQENEENKQKYSEVFYDLMMNQKFMFSSPTLFNAGTDFPLCSSCFVGQLEDDMAGIMKAASDTAITFKAGAGMGLNFSVLRPKGAYVGRGGTSSGPVSFMRLFDEVGETVKSGGVRRAAFMAMMDVDHPDIEEFITSKDYVADLKRNYKNLNVPENLVNETMGKINGILESFIEDENLLYTVGYEIRKKLFEPLYNMNISVAVKDDFMKAVIDDRVYELNKGFGMNKTVEAKKLFSKIATSAWQTADPGVWFIDRANEFDTVPSFGKINSTNPCGEQSLHNYTSCNLGSINLTRFVDEKSFFLEEDFKETVRYSIRALDNIIDTAAFPTKDFEINTRKIRPVGLGFTGLAEVLYRMNLAYDSEEGIQFAENIARIMTQTAIRASVEIAEEKGSFEEFENNKEALISVVKKYFDTEEEKKEIEKDIREKGIRNSNWTTLAPTGTISLILDAYTYSLEPQFALAYYKNLVDGDTLIYTDPEFKKAVGDNQELIEKVVQNGGSCQNVEGIPEEVKKVFVVSHDIHYSDRINMQAALQKYISNSISSTINLPSDATIEAIEDIYLKAWQKGLKGVTIYKDGTKYFQPMTTEKNKKKSAENSAAVKNRRWKRPKSLKADIIRTKTGSGTLYTTVGLDENGYPLEIFINISKHGSEISAFSEALGRVLSIALQQGVPADTLAETIKGIHGDSPTYDAGRFIKSVPDAIGVILKEYADKIKTEEIEPELFKTHSNQNQKDEEINHEIEGALICPVCGEKSYLRTEDCYTCMSCGYSKCG